MPPPRGMARIYVFRPAFSQNSAAEQPILSIDGHRASLLAQEHFDSFALPPGTHTISLEPRPGEAQAWHGAMQLELKADTTTFLAVWNVVEAESYYSLLPVAGMFALNPRTRTRSSGVHFEVIEHSEALPVVATMHRLRRLPDYGAP